MLPTKPSTLIPQTPQQENDHFALLFGQHSKPAKTFKRYQKVVVLMLHWEDTDMDTEEEVKALEHVFKEDYKFVIENFRIAKGSNAQLEINFRVAEFVRDHQEKGTLLIIYYAGHGKAMEEDGKFMVAGRVDNDAERHENDHMAIWQYVETLIGSTAQDVFVILDCCYAGALCKTRDPQSLRFEYLGACGPDRRTPQPGPTSFTRALIWALLELKNGPPFTTQKLREMICENKNFKKKNRIPYLASPWNGGSKELIMICPMDRKLNGIATNMKESPSQYLDLRFFFSQKVTASMVIHIAKQLRALSEEKDLWIDYVAYLGRYNTVERTRIYVNRWLESINKKRSSKSLSTSSSLQTSSPAAYSLGPSVESQNPPLLSLQTPIANAGALPGLNDRTPLLTPASDINNSPVRRWSTQVTSIRVAVSQRPLTFIWALTCLVLFVTLLVSLYFNFKLLGGFMTYTSK